MSDSDSSPHVTEIELMGEQGFPGVHTDRHDIVDDLGDLRLSAATTVLVERWMALVTEDRDEVQDDTILAAVRAAAAIKRELGPGTRVNFSMRDPRVGEWMSFDARSPGFDGSSPP